MGRPWLFLQQASRANTYIHIYTYIYIHFCSDGSSMAVPTASFTCEAYAAAALVGESSSSFSTPAVIAAGMSITLFVCVSVCL